MRQIKADAGLDAKELHQLVERVQNCKNVLVGSSEQSLDEEDVLKRTMKRRDDFSDLSAVLHEKLFSLFQSLAFVIFTRSTAPGQLWVLLSSSENVPLEMRDSEEAKYSRLIEYSVVKGVGIAMQ